MTNQSNTSRGRLTETTAKTTADVMRWIIANEHYEGYWTGPVDNRVALVLKGPTALLTIPADVHVPGMMKPTNYHEKKRMFEPSEAGRAALQEQKP